MKLQLTICALVAALLGAYVLPAFGALPVSAAPDAANKIQKELKGKDLKDKSGKKVGTFDGQIEITGVKVDKGSKKLLISGEVTGTAKQNGQEKKVSEKFTDVAASLLPGQTRCDILTLDIPDEGLVLNLLGLVIDVGPVEIDIYAISGGGLLGDLLCGLVNLLNNP
jgi:hypothetical protein